MVKLVKTEWKQGEYIIEDWILQSDDGVCCLHNEHGPARITYYKSKNIKESEEWYNKGFLHNYDAPAKIVYFEEGQKDYEEWYVQNRMHRVNGPARVVYNRRGVVLEEEWWVNDMYHRTDGPARITYREDGKKILKEYWLKNRIVNEEKMQIYQILKELGLYDKWDNNMLSKEEEMLIKMHLD